ncbi:tetratricopeptide repeat protein [Burkholderia pyrrocinia]
MVDAKIVELINQIGYCLRRRRQFDSALRVFKALQKMQPGHAYPHMGQALVYAEQGDVDEAKLHLQLVLSRHPNHSFALVCLGLTMLSRDSKSDWRTLLSQAADIDDDMGGKSIAREILRQAREEAKSHVGAAIASSSERLKRFS